VRLPHHALCDNQTAGCKYGETIVTHTRYDYVLAFDSLLGANLRAVDVAAARLITPVASGSGLGGIYGSALSDHPALVVELAPTDDWLAVIVVTASAAALLIGCAVAFLLYRRGLWKVSPSTRMFGRQLRLMFRKNITTTIRNRRAVAVQLLTAVFFLALLQLSQYAMDFHYFLSEPATVRLHSNVQPIPAIPRCVIGPHNSGCFSFGYTPCDDPFLNDIMHQGPNVVVDVSLRLVTSVALRGCHSHTSLRLCCGTHRSSTR